MSLFETLPGELILDLVYEDEVEWIATIEQLKDYGPDHHVVRVTNGQRKFNRAFETRPSKARVIEFLAKCIREAGK